MMTHENMEAGSCCPPFDPSVWNEKTSMWTEKPFIRDTVRQVGHIPLPGSMQKTIGRMWQQAKDAGAQPEMKDFLLLAYDPSAWKSELYMTVTKDVPGADNVRLSGTFITKVYEGPYNGVPKWLKDMDAYVASQGKTTDRYYVYFPLCPECAAKTGHNYAVVFAKIK
jgi:hypothetical protein